MKKVIFICLLSVAYALPSFAAPQEKSLDHIVAIVNDDVITKSELNQSFNMIKAQLQQQGMLKRSERKIQHDVLEQLINKKLQLQMAKQAGINVTDHDLNQAVSNIARQNSMSVSEFYQRLATEGMNKETYLNEMREQLTIQKLQQQQIISRIVITPEEVTEYSKNSRQEATQTTKTYHLQDILIPFSDDPSDSEIAKANQIAQTVVTQLQEGKALQPTLQSFKDPKVTMKDMGNLELGDVPSAFVDAVKTMQKNEVSKPIQTGNGIHIVRAVDVRNRTLNGPQLSSVEIQNKIGEKKFAEELQVWLAKLRSQAYIVNKLNG